MAYDPLNGRIVVVYGSVRLSNVWLRSDDVWAFDVATRVDRTGAAGHALAVTPSASPTA